MVNFPFGILVMGLGKPIPPEGMVFYNYDDEFDVGLTVKEKMMLFGSVLKNTGVVLVNLQKVDLSIEEILILQMAYTNNIPILGVGEHPSNKFLKEIVTREFKTYEEVIEHIITHYVL